MDVEPGRKAGQCVLVVDDHPKVLRFIEICLKVHGFKVVCVSSGDDALEIINSAEPDIVLLDIVMPHMDGFEVLKRLRSFTLLPVVAFSASPGNYDEALRLGANAFVTKPFEPEELVERIKSVLARAKLSD